MERSHVRIGRVTLGRVPRVVLVVDDRVRGLRRALREGVDLLEARVDRFHRFDLRHVTSTVRALRRYGVPVIGTVRSHAEGGARRLSNAARYALYEAIAPLVNALDIELRSEALLGDVAALARRSHSTLIVSYHDFQRMPSKATLGQVVRRAGSSGADLIKIAARARKTADVVRLLEFTLRHPERPLVTIAMGPEGTISRLVFPLAGSRLTYTSLSVRDGQLPLPALVEGLRLCDPARRPRKIR